MVDVLYHYILGWLAAQQQLTKTLERTAPSYTLFHAVKFHGEPTGSTWGGVFLSRRTNRSLSLLHPEGLATGAGDT